MATRRGARCSTERGTPAKTMCKHRHKLCFTGALIHEDIKNVTCVTLQRSNCRAGLLRALQGESQVLRPAAAQSGDCPCRLPSASSVPGVGLGLVLPFLTAINSPARHCAFPVGGGSRSPGHLLCSRGSAGGRSVQQHQGSRLPRISCGSRQQF